MPPNTHTRGTTWQGPPSGKRRVSASGREEPAALPPSRHTRGPACLLPARRHPRAHLLALLGAHGLDLAVAVDDGEGVHELALVLVDALDLCHQRAVGGAVAVSMWFDSATQTMLADSRCGVRTARRRAGAHARCHCAHKPAAARNTPAAVQHRPGAILYCIVRTWMSNMELVDTS